MKCYRGMEKSAANQQMELPIEHRSVIIALIVEYCDIFRLSVKIEVKNFKK